MNILLLGAGGREHALAWKLARSRRVRRVFIGPGNAGTAAIGTNLPGVNPLGFDTIEAACREHAIDCVFVGPETPLAEGVVDYLGQRGLKAIGPNRSAARLESSKAFSKSFLVRNSLPTADAAEFSDRRAFERHLDGRRGERLVVKKSGLAAGKGVLESSDTAELARFGAAILPDDRLLVEEFLDGWEVSIFGLSDGESWVVLPPCADFKKAHDGDTGPNTGGMGSICPVPRVDAALMERITRDIVAPTYEALAREGLAYAGILYFGLMIAEEGPKVLEFNVRFGDPETQVLMPVMDADLGEIVEAMAGRSLGTLTRVPPPAAVGAASGPAALGVVIAAAGYPEKSVKGTPVDALPAMPESEGLLFHASSVCGRDGIVRTGGGRSFTAVGVGSDLRRAAEMAYSVAEKVRFEGAWFRRDIGRRFMEDPR